MSCNVRRFSCVYSSAFSRETLAAVSDDVDAQTGVTTALVAAEAETVVVLDVEAGTDETTALMTDESKTVMTGTDEAGAVL